MVVKNVSPNSRGGARRKMTHAEKLSGGERAAQNALTTYQLRKTVQENIKADIESLIKKYGVKDIRDFARKLLFQAAMEENMRRAGKRT